MVKNLLNNMDVKCNYHEKGCLAVVKMDQLDKHMEECRYNSEEKTNKMKIEVNLNINIIRLIINYFSIDEDLC